MPRKGEPTQGSILLRNSLGSRALDITTSLLYF